MLADDLAHSWPAIRAELQRAVPPTVYQVWLERIEPRELRGRTVVLAAPRPPRPPIAGRFPRVLQTCAAAVLGADVGGDVGGTAAHADRQTGGASASPAPRAGTPELNPKYTFEQFVI